MCVLCLQSLFAPSGSSVKPAAVPEVVPTVTPLSDEEFAFLSTLTPTKVQDLTARVSEKCGELGAAHHANLAHGKLRHVISLRCLRFICSHVFLLFASFWAIDLVFRTSSGQPRSRTHSCGLFSAFSSSSGSSTPTLLFS